MPIPKPVRGETQQGYVSRVIKKLVDEGRDQKQAAAIAYDMWKKGSRKKGK